MTAPSVPRPGTTFPELSLLDPDGEPHRLADLAAGRAAVVFFMRSPSCPVCRVHLRELERLVERGDLGDARPIVVTPGGADDAAAVARRTALPVHASGAQHAAVGLGRFLFLQHSGTFVLDSEGRVVAARASALPTASFSAREVVAALHDIDPTPGAARTGQAGRPA